MMMRYLTLLAALWLWAAPAPVLAQGGPLRITIDEGVIEPLPFAAPDFVAENTAAAQLASQIARVVAADLTGTGLFREIPKDAFISQITSFASPVQFADWRVLPFKLAVMR